MLPYRSLAESWRVMTAYRLRNRAEIVANNIRANMDDPWTVVSFFYPVDGITKRLSDEDFREIFFLLTDAYPEEINDNPDPIHILTSLSETEITKATGHAVVNRIHSILDAPDNETRAWLIRSLFERINQRDLHPFFMRLSVRASPIRRRDVVAALGLAYDHPYHHMRSSVNLLGLRPTVRNLSLGTFDFAKVRPIRGVPIVLPSPVLVQSPDAVVFGKCFVEMVEGTWVTIHHDSKKTVGFTASGGELPDDDGWLARWAKSAELQEGIWLCDYAEHRDVPLLLVDSLTPSDSHATFMRRRPVSVPWAVKPMQLIDSPMMLHEMNIDLPFVLHNSSGILTYENTIEERVLLNPVKKERVVRVLSGRITASASGGSPVMVWKLGVRDGFDYYPVCEVSTNLDFKQYCAPYKVLEGEAVKVDTPLFVNVEVLASGWGDIGAYMNCRITGIAHSAGLADCIGVEELGYVDTEPR